MRRRGRLAWRMKLVSDGGDDDAVEGVGGDDDDGRYVNDDGGEEVDGEDDDATSMSKEFPGPTVVANSTWYLLGCVVVRAVPPLCCGNVVSLPLQPAFPV